MSIGVEDDVFLNFVEQMWHLHGSLPTKDKCTEYGFDNKFYTRLTRSSEYREQLIKRGIREAIVDEIQTSAKDRGILTERQLTAANVMLDLRDNRSQRKKLEECQVSTGEWSAWLKDAVFQNYLRARAENMLGDNQYEAHYALLSRVRSGDISAIKYFNELTGRYVPTKDTGNFDVKMLLTRIIEAIQKHVQNPETQQAIADEIMGYARATGIAASIMEERAVIPIPVPAIIDGNESGNVRELPSLTGPIIPVKGDM